MSNYRTIPKVELSALSPEDMRTLSSIETERLLTEQIDQLKLLPLPPESGLLKVGNFWHATWSPAPFEEDLTLNQIKTLDVRQLLQKRSMNNEKVLRIAMALNNALVSLSPKLPGKAKPKKALKKPVTKKVKSPTGRVGRKRPLKRDKKKRVS